MFLKNVNFVNKKHSIIFMYLFEMLYICTDSLSFFANTISVFFLSSNFFLPFSPKFKHPGSIFQQEDKMFRFVYEKC